MENSKTAALFSAMEAKDIRRFRKFASSPYFNQNEHIIQLIDFLFEDNHFDSVRLDRERLFGMLWPGEDFDYFKISLLLSDLNRLVEQFYMVEDLGRQSSQQHLLQLESLNMRRLDKPFSASLKQWKKGFRDPESYHSEQDFLFDYQVAGLEDKWFMDQGQRTASESHFEKMKKLELFYLAALLKDLCEAINRLNIIQSGTEKEKLDDKLNFVQQKYPEHQHHPFIRMYFGVLEMLSGENREQAFFELKQDIRQNVGIIPKAEMVNIYRYAQNFCIRQINSGNPDYAEILFDLYLLALDEALIVDEYGVSHWDFKNVVSLGLRLGKFEWTEQFIRDYHGRLPDEIRVEALNYNLASLEYARENRGKALKLLHGVNLKDVYYHTGARILMMKIYFDRSEWDALDAVIHAFANYLKRNKSISGYQLAGYKNLIRAFRMIGKLKSDEWGLDDREIAQKRAKVKQRIHALKNVPNMNWILEKLEEREEVSGG